LTSIDFPLAIEQFWVETRNAGIGPSLSRVMKPMSSTAETWLRVAAHLSVALMLLTAAASPALAAGCAFEPQGEGRVASVIDPRGFRLEDGREVLLAGIEPAGTEKATGIAALAAIVAGREVTLRWADDTPDRYGREPAIVFVDGSHTPVQAQLLAQGAALAAADVADKDCAALLAAAEAEARKVKRGAWASASAIKNAESAGDILAGIGRFTIVEGKVLSVRQAGATTYLNFGRNWTRDFAVTISRRMLAAFEAAGVAPKSFENRRIRVRGWVEVRSGPRIEALRVGQIELVSGD
jgi:endonuclease YncB( thermonuclease family)